jgi:putative ABC transport system ATP-binding protein
MRGAANHSGRKNRVFALQNISHAYAGQPVLEVPNWQVEQGAHRLVLGPSGSGKTTLLHVLGCILKLTVGNVSIAGQDMGSLSPAARDRFRGQHIGIVLQRLHLVASLSVTGNLLLASLDLANKGGAMPHELSHGQAQRVAVARAGVNRAQLLLADEPTSNLDDGRCMQALDLLESQARECKATPVIATHDQRSKARISSH